MRTFALLTLLLVAVALVSPWQCSASAQPQKNVEASPYLLERVKNKEWLLLDVRSEEEYQQGHIPGAVNVPYDAIDQYLSSIDGYKNKPVIVYCRSGRRAKLAMKELEDKQFDQLMHLEGDMLGWNERNLPVEKLPMEKM